MRTEELRYIITLQKLNNTINENGFESGKWEDVVSVYAAITNLHGKEFFEAAAVQAENIVKFTIRFRNDISNDMKIKFKEKQYNIIHIDNIKFGNRYMEIKAIEIEKG